MALQKEGVLLAVEGAQKFVSQMDTVYAAYKKTTDYFAKGVKYSSLEQASTGIEKTISGFGNLGGVTDKLGGAAGIAKTAIGGLSIGVVAAGAAAVGAVAGIVALGKGMMDLAEQTASLQGVMFQFKTQTQLVEGGGEAMLRAMQKASSGMISNRDLMQKYNSAASLVSRNFAEQMPRALSILTKTAAATGKDINYLFDSFVRGVGRASPLVLDNLEIQSSLSASTQFATEMFKKQEDQLTESEKQAAMAAFTLERLEATYGAMPDVTESAAAQSAIFNAQMQNIRDTLGQFLLPAFTAVKQGINAVVTAFSSAISEGGGLYPVFVNLGAILSIAADGFRDLATRVADFIGNFGLAADETTRGSEMIADNFGNIATSWIDKVGGMVEDAIMWGANLVTNFAVGMIDAANTVLTWAMQQIGNILTFWLAPGSPPKILPNLNKWGIAAFEEYLKGMTEADFGLLESVQGPLKKVLEGPAFADVSKAFAGAIAGGDRAGALKILADSSKQFGDEIAELGRREFALADATTAVEIAEKALTAAQNEATAAQERARLAQERAARAGKAISVEVAKYNELLREGASKDVLDAQLARINASEREANALQDAANMAQTEADISAERADTAKLGVDEAKGRVDSLKTEVDLQKKLLDQLFGIQEALTITPEREAKEKAAKEGKPIDIPEPALPPAAGGIGGAIASAIEAAKQRIKDSLGGIWDTIKTEFSDKWNEAIGRLGDTWDTFRGRVGELWDTVVSKVEIPWSRLVTLWDATWSWIQQYLLPILDDLKTLGLLAVESAVVLLGQTWDKFKTQVLMPFWDWLSGTFIKGWEAFHTWLTETVQPWIETTFGAAWAKLGEKIEEFRNKVLGPIQTGLEALQGVLETLHERLSALITKWQQWLNRKKDTANMPQSPYTPYSLGLSLAADQMERIATHSAPMMESAMDALSTSTQSVLRGIERKGFEMLAGVTDPMVLKERQRDFEQYRDQVMSMLAGNQFAFQPAGVGTFRQPAGAVYNQQRSYSVQVGPNQMGGAASPAMLEAMVRRVLTRALGAGAR